MSGNNAIKAASTLKNSDKNTIINLILSAHKQKRKKRKQVTNNVATTQEQITTPPTLQEIASRLPPAPYAPTNVVTVNPANYPVPTMFDVQRQQQLNAYMNMQDNLRNEIEDLRFNAEPQISELISSGRMQDAETMTNAINQLEAYAQTIVPETSTIGTDAPNKISREEISTQTNPQPQMATTGTDANPFPKQATLFTQTDQAPQMVTTGTDTIPFPRQEMFTQTNPQPQIATTGTDANPFPRQETSTQTNQAPQMTTTGSDPSSFPTLEMYTQTMPLFGQINATTQIEPRFMRDVSSQAFIGSFEPGATLELMRSWSKDKLRAYARWISNMKGESEEQIFADLQAQLASEPIPMDISPMVNTTTSTPFYELSPLSREYTPMNQSELRRYMEQLSTDGTTPVANTSSSTDIPPTPTSSEWKEINELLVEKGMISPQAIQQETPRLNRKLEFPTSPITDADFRKLVKFQQLLQQKQGASNFKKEDMVEFRTWTLDLTRRILENLADEQQREAFRKEANPKKTYKDLLKVYEKYISPPSGSR